MLVQGFKVISFVCKKDFVKVILISEKDDIRAGTGDISDVLTSLELHSTAADSSTVNVGLRESEDSQTSVPYPFVVSNFLVKQDSIKLILEASIEDTDILKALGTHILAEGEQNAVELDMQVPE